MKTELYTNCSLVRIPIKAGVTEYHFPMNVDWAKRKIDKMLFLQPLSQCLDPVDGVSNVTTTGVNNAFVDLYSADGREIVHNVSAGQMTNTDNNALTIDAQLDLQLCRLFYTVAPTADQTLLVYVFYGTRTEEYYDLPKKSVTAVFPLQANEQKSFQEIINDYVRALPGRIQGIVAWNTTAAAYITLRDRALTYMMTDIHTDLCRHSTRSPYPHSYAQKQPFLLNDLDIDFDNSFIREARGINGTQTITFYFN